MAERLAPFLLLLVAALWGLTFPLIRESVATLDAYTWGAYRFSMAIVVFGIWFLRRGSWVKMSWRLLAEVVLLGGVLGLSYITQTVGLETISSARSAFITGTNVIMVPLIVWILDRKRMRTLEMVCAVFALLGLYLLTDPSRSGWSLGDTLTLVCALCYALYVVHLQSLVKRFPDHTFELTLIQIAVVWVMSCSLFPWMDKPLVRPTPQIWVALLYCATFATVGTAWLQTRFQRYVSAQRAALIYATEPVFAAVFGYMLLGERLGALGLLGAATIMTATVLPQVIRSKS